jgi:hypothetical protein
MSEFTADWLALREPADARARSARLARLVADRLAGIDESRVLDLAAGTGANVRYLADFLPGGQHRPEWLLVDRDHDLLARATAQMRTRGHIETRPVDLAFVFEPAPADADDPDEIFAGRDLVTASSLLDLVSERWLELLALRCRDAGAAVLFALTYNGDVRCSPAEPEDDAVRDLVNRHQRTDKGFGPALGPAASRSAARLFAALGYEVQRERSDWVLGADASDLQQQLLDGWAAAAVAIAPEQVAALDGWRARRLAHVAAGRSRIVVGHDDLAAWL